MIRAVAAVQCVVYRVILQCKTVGRTPSVMGKRVTPFVELLKWQTQVYLSKINGATIRQRPLTLIQLLSYKSARRWDPDWIAGSSDFIGRKRPTSAFIARQQRNLTLRRRTVSLIKYCRHDCAGRSSERRSLRDVLLSSYWIHTSK